MDATEKTVDEETIARTLAYADRDGCDNDDCETTGHVLAKAYRQSQAEIARLTGANAAMAREAAEWEAKANEYCEDAAQREMDCFAKQQDIDALRKRVEELDGAVTDCNRIAQAAESKVADQLSLIQELSAKLSATKDREQMAERALQPFDLAHLSVLAGDNPMKDISLADLRIASEVYHLLNPAPEVSHE